MLIIQITRKGAWTLKTLREQYVGTPPKFFENLLITTEKNEADFVNLIPQIDSYLYTRIGNLTTMEDTTEYRTYVRAWWYSAVDSLNRAYRIYVPEDTRGYNYNPLENYSMTEGTTAKHNQGKLKTEGNVEDPVRTTANYTSTQDSATTGRLEGYTVTGQGNSIPPSDQTAKIDSSSETWYTSKASDTAHDGTTTVSADVLDVVTHDRTGNIGVMSSQDMANQELELRKGHFFNYFCEMFTKDCTSGAWGGGYDL